MVAHTNLCCCYYRITAKNQLRSYESFTSCILLAIEGIFGVTQCFFFLYLVVILSSEINVLESTVLVVDWQHLQLFTIDKF